jgi:hypothetical protein
MSVYFDHRLKTDSQGINTDVSWFSGSPLLSVNSYSDASGGAVHLYMEEVFVIIFLLSDLFMLIIDV